MSRFAPALAAVLLLVSAAFADHGHASDGSLTLLYTASLNGNMDGCDCISNPRSGLIKRAAFLRSLDGTGATVLVDAGDLMDVYPDAPLADLIVGTYARLGYDAVSVGDQDFSNGLLRLLGYRNSLPFLAGNLTVCPDANTCSFFSPYPLIFERGGVKVAVQSVLDRGAFILYPGEVKESVKLSDAASAVENFLACAEEEKADLRLLLYHGRYDEALSAVETVSKKTGRKPDVVVVGHEQRLIEENVNGTMFVSPGPEGNRVGMLGLTVRSGKVVFGGNRFRLLEYAVDPDEPEAARAYAAYLDGMKRRLRKQ